MFAIIIGGLLELGFMIVSVVYFFKGNLGKGAAWALLAQIAATFFTSLAVMEFFYTLSEAGFFEVFQERLKLGQEGRG